MKPKAYIFDIDGTLADCSHRLHHITGSKKDYDAFYAACTDDDLIINVAELCLNLSINSRVIYITGRPERIRGETNRWIIKNRLPCPLVYMRRDGDHRPDYVIKQEIYEREIKDKYDVIGVFEDRQQCVDMWRKLGLTCFQVANGNY